MSPEDICSSCALSYDLDSEIRPRFVFVDRAGLYRHPNPKSVGLTGRAEPPPADVINSDLDEYLAFACQGRLTAQEYHTFLTAFFAEEQRWSEKDYYCTHTVCLMFCNVLGLVTRQRMMGWTGNTSRILSGNRRSFATIMARFLEAQPVAEGTK